MASYKHTRDRMEMLKNKVSIILIENKTIRKSALIT